MKLSQWYTTNPKSPMFQKPWEVGAYKRLGWGGPEDTYTYWNGAYFGYLGRTPDEAMTIYQSSGGKKSCHQDYAWQGIIKE